MNRSERLETDEYGLFIHGDNYAECRADVEHAERRRIAWEAMPWWKKLFIDKFKWSLRF